MKSQILLSMKVTKNMRVLSYIGLLAYCFLAASCGMSGPNSMISTTMDGKTGKTETKVFSGFYNAAEWIEEGNLGLEVWIDHKKDVVPLLNALQQATGTLGPNDMRADGLITLYFVNLQQKERKIQNISARTIRNESASSGTQSTVGRPRALNKAVLGTVPISNYAHDVSLTIKFEVDGVAYEKVMKVKRLTQTEMDVFSSPGGKAPYPWFAAPYYPFNPPISQPI